MTGVDFLAYFFFYHIHTVLKYPVGDLEASIYGSRHDGRVGRFQNAGAGGGC